MRAALFALLTLAALPAEAVVRSVTLEKPARDFGFFLGDTMTATARIATDPSTVLDPATLPARGPINGLIDVRRVQVESGWSGGARLYRIHIEYQNFYPPDAATHVPVPGYNLDFTDASQRFTASIPGWSFLVSPLRHNLSPMTDIAGLQPDQHGSPAPSGPWRAMLLSALVAAAAAAFLLFRHLRLPGIVRARPFARAARQLAALRAAPGADGSELAAMLSLHRAFDATAGQALLAQDVGTFLARHPRFAALSAEIEAFFADSARLFYGGHAPAPDLGRLADFGRALARAERG